jgi:uncharacterized SAM-binding protein YcdF (DUF218 family)
MSYLQPVFPALVFLLLFLGVRLYAAGRGKAVLLTAVALFLWSAPAVAWLSSASLERWYPVRDPAGSPDVIVVLSEGERAPPHPSQYEPLPSFGTYLRTRYAAWLYHHWRQVPIVVTGGRAHGEDFPVADVMQHVLVAEAVPAEKIWVDRDASSTYENAVNVSRMLRSRNLRTVALVTEAHHMLRSEKCFRKQGLAVIPAPCGYRKLEYVVSPSLLWPNVASLQRNGDALHEWVGMLWYWIRGWT